jgi:predicted kinase
MAFFVIIRGPLGVGKTTVSNALANAIGAKVCSIDQLVDRDWDGGSLRLFLKANRTAAKDAATALQAGTPVVFDGCFYWKSQIKDLESRLPFSHQVFTLEAPLSVCILRDSHRNPSFGAEAAAQVFRKVHRFEYGLMLDGTREVPRIVQEIRSHLPRRKAGFTAEIKRLD